MNENIENLKEETVENLKIFSPENIEFEKSNFDLGKSDLENIKVAKKKAKNAKINSYASRGWKIAINIIYFIFAGFWEALFTIICGVLECITIIGIPCGIVLFKTIPLVSMPFDKRVVTDFSSHPFLNIFWIVFGGLEIAVIHWLFSVSMYITIIGIPLAKQMFKINKMLWAPFGSKILNEIEFESEEDETLAYTMHYLRRNKIVVKTDNLILSNSEKEDIQAFSNRSLSYEDVLLKDSKTKNRGVVQVIMFGIFIVVCITLILILCFTNILSGPIEFLSRLLPKSEPLLFLVILTVPIFIVLLITLAININHRFFATIFDARVGYGNRKVIIQELGLKKHRDPKKVALLMTIYESIKEEVEIEKREFI